MKYNKINLIMKSIIYQIAQDTRVRDERNLSTQLQELVHTHLRLLIGGLFLLAIGGILGFVGMWIGRDKCKWCKLWNLRVMGFFSFKTTDTGESISNKYSERDTFYVTMIDNTGHWWTEGL